MVTASLWLRLTDDDRARRLDEAVRAIAAALDGPVFEPHVTLAAQHEAPEADWAALRDRVRRRWAEVGPVEARFEPVTTSAERFRAAVLPLAPAPWVDELRAFGAELGLDVLPRPHLSLAYVVPEPPRDLVLRHAGALPASAGLDRLAFVPHAPGEVVFRPEPL